jgi:hypothetical protein
VQGGLAKVSPAPLNEGEFYFIEDLKEFYSKNPELFIDKEMYVLRNRSRGKGIGFFEAGNFYPDFIVWILYQGKQYITFVDPKGLKEHSLTDKKIQFYRQVKAF